MSLDMCATISELPSNINTMVRPDALECCISVCFLSNLYDKKEIQKYFSLENQMSYINGLPPIKTLQMRDI